MAHRDGGAKARITEIGPRAVYTQIMDRLSIAEINSGLGLSHPLEGTIDIVGGPILKANHFIRAVLRRKLLERAEQRKRLVGASQANLKVTAELLRTDCGPHRSPLIAVLADGLWHRRQKFLAGFVPDDVCTYCDSGRVENTCHILHDCARWEHLRSWTASVSECLETAPISAKACGFCPGDASHEVQKAWPQYQRCLATIWQARIKDEHKPVREDGASQEVLTQDDDMDDGGAEVLDSDGVRALYRDVAQPPTGCFPPPQTQLMKDHATPFQFAPTMHVQGREWNYPDAQWHQLVLFLARCSVPCEVVPVQCPTILEVWLSYLVVNGMHRLYTGVPDEHDGGWMSAQVENMRLMLLVFQNRAKIYPPLLESDRACRTPKTKWPTNSLPAMMRLSRPLLLPQHDRVCGLVHEILEFVHEYPYPVTRSMEIWRRPQLGIKQSQLYTRGMLATHLPLSTVHLRLGSKSTPPLLHLSTFNALQFARTLEMHPVAASMVGDKSFLEIVRGHAVTTKQQFANFCKHIRRVQRLCAWMVMLPIDHEGTMQHICVDPNLTRATCARCGAVGRLRHTKAWYQGSCSQTVPGFDMAGVYASVKSVHTYYDQLARIAFAIPL
eukprot:6490430-Amphidinium_carterae.1